MSTQTLKSENAKTAIAAALITGITTVLVSFIGIVPSMRQNDSATITDLQNQIYTLITEIEELNMVAPDEVYSIEGKINNIDEASKYNAVLYAARADGLAHTDHNGRFIFQKMLLKPYWILVADENNRVRRLLIKPEDHPPEGKAGEVTITYKFEKEESS